MKVALMLPVLGLNMFALAGCASQPTSIPAQANLRWQAMASDDLNAIHTLIQEAHPGWLDYSNPAFRRWAEGGYLQAKALIPKVSSYDTALSAVRYYVNGFKDAHFTYSDNLGLPSPTESLNGWMVHEMAGNFVVTASIQLECSVTASWSATDEL